MKKFTTYKLSVQIFALAVFIFAAASCTERIDLEVGSTYTRLAVEGYITPKEGNQWIRLTKTGEYFSNTQPVAVSGANIIVDDGAQLITFTEDSLKPGLYKAPDDYKGIPGNIFTLDIKLAEEINGESSFSATERMPHPSDKIDSVGLEYNPQWEMWMVKLYAQEPPSEDFYMFNGYVNGEIITDSVSRKSVSDDRLFNGNYTSGAIVMVVRGEELVPGDIFTLELSNITQEYYNFIVELQTEIQPNNPLFSGPPANVSSNLSNDAVGYFACYPSVFSSTVAKVDP